MAKTAANKEVIYINGHIKERMFFSYGIDFSEFYYSLANEIENILLLKHKFDGGQFNMHTKLSYVEKDDLPLLARDDTMAYGTFCWVDTDDVGSLDLLDPREIAELLYLGHMGEPLSSPFNLRLNNRFVYLAQEDGFFNKIYYKEIHDFKRLLSQAITIKLSSLLKRKFSLLQKQKPFPPLAMEQIQFLLPLAEKGLLIDLREQQETRKTIEIPLYTIGTSVDFDELLIELNAHKQKARLKYTLIFNKKLNNWSIL